LNRNELRITFKQEEYGTNLNFEKANNIL